MCQILLSGWLGSLGDLSLLKIAQFSPHTSNTKIQNAEQILATTNPMSFRCLCKVSLVRGVNGRIDFPQILISWWSSAFLSPSREHIPVVLFWLHTRSQAMRVRYVSCSSFCVSRVSLHSLLWDQGIIFLKFCSEAVSWLQEVWADSHPSLFFSLSKSFPFPVLWIDIATVCGWSTSYVSGRTVCLDAVWENSFSPACEMEPSVNAATAPSSFFHLR